MTLKITRWENKLYYADRSLDVVVDEIRDGENVCGNVSKAEQQKVFETHRESPVNRIGQIPLASSHPKMSREGFCFWITSDSSISFDFSEWAEQAFFISVVLSCYAIPLLLIVLSYMCIFNTVWRRSAIGESVKRHNAAGRRVSNHFHCPRTVVPKLFDRSPPPLSIHIYRRSLDFSLKESMDNDSNNSYVRLPFKGAEVRSKFRPMWDGCAFLRFASIKARESISRDVELRRKKIDGCTVLLFESPHLWYTQLAEQGGVEWLAFSELLTMILDNLSVKKIGMFLRLFKNSPTPPWGVCLPKMGTTPRELRSNLSIRKFTLAVEVLILSCDCAAQI